MSNSTPAVHCKYRYSKIHNPRRTAWTSLCYANQKIAEWLNGAEQNVVREVEAGYVNGYRAIAEAAVKASVARDHIEAQQMRLDPGEIVVAQSPQMNPTDQSLHGHEPSDTGQSQ